MENKWQNINGKMRVFKNTTMDNRVYYTTTLSTKKEDGTYNNMSLPVSFGKDLNGKIESGEINVKNGFITFYEKSDGTKNVKVVVMELEDELDLLSIDDDTILPF